MFKKCNGLKNTLQSLHKYKIIDCTEKSIQAFIYLFVFCTVRLTSWFRAYRRPGSVS